MRTGTRLEKTRRRRRSPWICLVLILSLSMEIGSAATVDTARYSPWIGEADSLLVKDDTGRNVVSIHADIPRIPASTLKIFTALMAIHYLGTGYRFPTEAWMNEKGNLVIKGFGDPLLTSEVISDFAGYVLQHKLGPFHQIIVDTTFFDSGIFIPGVEDNTEPYNAGVGALCANFNTVAFRTDDRGRLVSDEPQTPLVPLAMETIRRTGMRSGRISLSRDSRANARYAGELIAWFLKQGGAVFSGPIRVEAGGDPVGGRMVRWVSPYTLPDIVSRMLEFSSNFLANQLFLTCGVKAAGFPATREKAILAARRFISEHRLSESMVIVEGSGISRENRVSASDLDDLLVLFEPYRNWMKRQGGEWFKTGSLDGVRTRAGFMEGRDGRRYRFVVMLNTPGKTMEAVMKRLQEDLR